MDVKYVLTVVVLFLAAIALGLWITGHADGVTIG